MSVEHPRLHLHGFLSLDLCKELEFIHRSCGAVGYRPNVFSTTLGHLVATNCAHLILPFISVRERLAEKVEEFFGCEFELFIEFTGLISWCRGASIGWHSDDNRSYLKQRDFVDVLIYTADDRNVHAVDEVLDGERLTLTLWFTRKFAHNEDAKLISLLSQRLSDHERGKPNPFLPMPASDNMYWFSDGQFGFDIRCARVQRLGFRFCSLKLNTYDAAGDPLELLAKPVRLGRGNEIFDKEFNNSLHALQVIQFYNLKSSQLITSRRKQGSEAKSTESCLLDRMTDLELVLPCDHQLAEKVLGCMSYEDATLSFIWDDFAVAVTKWEQHMSSLYKELLALIPHWVTHQAIFYPPTS